jgi:hypothetical protein
MPAAALGRAATKLAVIVQRDVAVRMRDGVVLRADLYRPNRKGRFPVLLLRTPYGKAGKTDGVTDFGYTGAARGYVVIMQDVRGRYASGGEWYPFKNESEDGYDTVEWAATLPYANGKVGMFGHSYTGATQLLAAIAHPPHLAGICPGITASNYHDGWVYQGGAFEQWFSQTWTSGLAQDTLDRLVRAHTNVATEARKLPLASYQPFTLGLLSDSNLTATVAPYFLDWLAHPNYDDYWKRWSIEDHYADIKVPALTIAAWYDLFQGGSLRNYVGMKAHGGSSTARAGQRLIITVGGHSGGGRKVGDVDFGPQVAAFNENKTVLDWYDYLFKGVHNEFSKGKPVNLFEMGINQWRGEDSWPVPQVRNVKYFLHSEGKANSLHGGGRLSTHAPSSEPSDVYIYDPSNPVPTLGGPLCCDTAHLEPGARDQRPVEARDDVLVYSTAPLAHDIEVIGPVSLELYATSSAKDTDFAAKLVDVSPNGFARNLTEGIVRARYRNSQEHPELMKPGQVYQFKIDLWSTGNVFRQGHEIRLEVSSSNFPRFDRNLNTGENNGLTQRFVPARNTILHDALHPSALILPVIPAR